MWSMLQLQTSAPPLELDNCHRQYVNKRVWLCSNKMAFTRTHGSQIWFLHGLFFLNQPLIQTVSILLEMVVGEGDFIMLATQESIFESSDILRKAPVGQAWHLVGMVVHACIRAKLLQFCLTLWRPHGPQPTRLLCPWDSPGKNTGVGCHALLQGPGIEPESLMSPSLAGEIFTTRATTAWQIQ